MDIIANIKNEIALVIKNALVSLEEKGEISFGDQGFNQEIEIEIPKEKKNGDFSSNIAMKITKLVKKAPVVTANLLLDNFANHLSMF